MKNPLPARYSYVELPPSKVGSFGTSEFVIQLTIRRRHGSRTSFATDGTRAVLFVADCAVGLSTEYIY